ncbi:hypothetical protein GCM10020358_34600 [Amorphoplanes nipponensis]|uniref:FAS1 domain-containing protein n=1 Tax=Actinoplanes nipponensis TaxID=135950 RepID=A0A919JJT2_9ACTN|nr:fasciclin domain-containing protein [Actinoplanes nipponensis]GIE52078.1 hypothetical protein Ani05nite_56120 [Actinoplanes nipponensis]
MNVARLATRLTVAAMATVMVTTVAATGAEASTKPLAQRSLAQVLLKDKGSFDHNAHDFDILKAAVLAVLKAKPNSPVKVLTQGQTRLTAFLPNDGAFQLLAKEATKARKTPSEKKAFTTIAGLGIDTVESVLLYHVVPGVRVTKSRALKADNAKLKTALGKTVKVDVRHPRHKPAQVWLKDADTNDRNARVIVFNVNAGNRQIAHVVDRVLRPINLP